MITTPQQLEAALLQLGHGLTTLADTKPEMLSSAVVFGQDGERLGIEEIVRELAGTLLRILLAVQNHRASLSTIDPAA